MASEAMGSVSPARSITKIVAWMVAAPFLAVWPFISAMPAFGLLNGGVSKTWLWIDIVFVLAGFWPIFWLYVVAKLGSGSASSAARTGQGPSIALAWYALIWTAAYTAVLMLVK